MASLTLQNVYRNRNKNRNKQTKKKKTNNNNGKQRKTVLVAPRERAASLRSSLYIMLASYLFYLERDALVEKDRTSV